MKEKIEEENRLKKWVLKMIGRESYSDETAAEEDNDDENSSGRDQMDEKAGSSERPESTEKKKQKTHKRLVPEEFAIGKHDNFFTARRKFMQYATCYSPGAAYRLFKRSVGACLCGVCFSGIWRELWVGGSGRWGDLLLLI
jgi:hypothetical protein